MRYEILDNGSHPFLVDVKGKTVTVTKNNQDNWPTPGPNTVLFTVSADKVFIGKTSPQDWYENNTDDAGNSILLRIGNSYRYIGHEIYDFDPVNGDTILKFYSDVGNSDVPYPYAIGEKYVYNMLDHLAVEKSFFDMSKEIYDQFYYTQRVKMCLKGNPRTSLCADKNVYGPRLEEQQDKTVALNISLIEARNN